MPTMKQKDPIAALKREWRRYEKALPRLLRSKHKGRWIVFKDGRVQSAHDTEDEALISMWNRFGMEGGIVVNRVEKIKIIHLFAVQGA